MGKIKLNLFDFFRSCIQFIKILLVLLMMLLLLYWIQNLTGSFWEWFKQVSRFYDFLLAIGNSISSGSTELFNAKFEYKYVVALLIIGMFYALAHLLFIIVDKIEELCGDGVRLVKKIEENQFNRKLEKQNIAEQKKIKLYQIYVETFVKPKFAHREYNIDLDEQNKILIKHLLEKTNQCPQKYENGFLYTFNSFNQIDSMLDIFAKLFESKAPIDYVICVQIIGEDTRKETIQLKTLIGLKNINKITTMADTAYRYSFNDFQQYETSQLGVYQKETQTFELFQFIPKN